MVVVEKKDLRCAEESLFLFFDPVHYRLLRINLMTRERKVEWIEYVEGDWVHHR